MDLSKLSQHEKLAAVGAAALVLGGVIAAGSYRSYSLGWIGVLAGLAMLFVVLQPQIAAGMNLPGSRSSLMLVAGAIGGVVMALAFLTLIGFTFSGFTIIDLLWLIAVAGAAVMAWAAWQAFQADGGTFRIGSAASGSAATTDADAPGDEPAAPPPATEDEPERVENA